MTFGHFYFWCFEIISPQTQDVEKTSNLCYTGGADNSKNKPLMGISPRTILQNQSVGLTQPNACCDLEQFMQIRSKTKVQPMN